MLSLEYYILYCDCFVNQRALLMVVGFFSGVGTF